MVSAKKLKLLVKSVSKRCLGLVFRLKLPRLLKERVLRLKRSRNDFGAELVQIPSFSPPFVNYPCEIYCFPSLIYSGTDLRPNHPTRPWPWRKIALLKSLSVKKRKPKFVKRTLPFLLQKNQSICHQNTESTSLAVSIARSHSIRGPGKQKN